MAKKPTYEELELRIKELEKEAAERKRGEKVIREREEKFKAITGSAKDAIIMMDNEGNISYWNKAAKKIFGYSAHEALGKELHIFLAPQEYHDAYRGGILTFKRTGHGPAVGKTLELEAVRKDGTKFPIELSVSAFKIEEKWHATGIVRDITERKRAEQELFKAKEEAEAANQAKSTFLANMSHEFRTPMNAIIGYTDLLVDGVDGPINEEQEKSLKKIATNSRYLLQLINDILDISKIESGKVKLELKELDLKWIIESVIPTFEPLIKEKGLTLTDHLDEGLPLVYGDEHAIKQILINLLSNAVKFTHKGGITITARSSDRDIEPGEPPIFAEVCVEDTGIGIKEEDLDTLFDTFVHVDLTTACQGKVTGLGLSIARGLAALHNGTMWATSKYGEGSKFCFTIPFSIE